MKPKTIIDLKRLGWTVLIVIFLFPLVATAGILYYNYHLSPPALLKKKITIGQEYSEVKELFDEYKEKYKDVKGMSISTGETDVIDSKARKIPKGKYLHLYHVIVLDDLQLTVYFDKNDRVQFIDYIGD